MNLQHLQVDPIQLHNTSQKAPPASVKLQSDNASDYKPHQRLIDPIYLRLVIAYVLRTFTDAKVIILHFLFQLAVNSRTTPFIRSYPLPTSIIEDTIRHNIAQMTSTSKAYIPFPLAIIIKCCQMKDKDRHKHQWWSLRIT